MIGWSLLAVGKSGSDPFRNHTQDYIQKANHAGRTLGLGRLTLTDFPTARQKTAAERKQSEADLFLKASGSSLLIALDEKGQEMTTRDFASFLEKHLQSQRALSFIIGGPDGLAPVISEKAQFTLALGRFTLPHMMARLILAEQIYRALLLLGNHPYHRD